MADGRMLKRVVSESRRLAELKTDSARLLWTWVLPYLDIQGRYHADPDLIKGKVVPRLKTFTTKNIRAYLNDMAAVGLITLYQDDGEFYLAFRNFNLHQKLRENREAQSKIPPPPEDSTTTPGVLPELDGNTPPQVKLREDKLREDKKTLWPNKNSAGVVDDFEKFWMAYPKKVKKKDAYRSFQKIKTPIDLVLKAVERQKRSDQWQRDDGKYIPHPSTWLNQERWTDEVKEIKTGGPVMQKKMVVCQKCGDNVQETVTYREMEVCQACLKILDPEIDVRLRGVLEKIGGRV